MEGAALLGINTTTGDNIWKWVLIKPTPLRTDPLYGKVGNQWNIETLEVNHYFRFQHLVQFSSAFSSLLSSSSSTCLSVTKSEKAPP